MLLFTGVLGEELGWRGLLLKQLFTKWSFLAATLFSGVIWALFHLPLWLAPELGYSHLPFPVFGIQVISGTLSCFENLSECRKPRRLTITHDIWKDLK